VEPTECLQETGGCTATARLRLFLIRTDCQRLLNVSITGIGIVVIKNSSAIELLDANLRNWLEEVSMFGFLNRRSGFSLTAAIVAGVMAPVILSPSFAAPVIKLPELVKDIWPGTGSSFPQVPINVNGTLFFTADDGVQGRELWKSDGTEVGTEMVADINPGGSSSPGNLTDVNGTLFFSANNGINGAELWKSVFPYDSAHTTMVADINAGPGSSNPHNLINVNGTLFFAADPGSGVSELCTSTGVGASCTGSTPSNPLFLTNLNGTVYFRADDADHGSELWKSSGGPAELVKDINPILANPPMEFPTESSFIQKIVNINGTLFLAASDGVNGIELWKSDGTADGTVMVKDINPGGGFSLGEGGQQVNFAEYNGSLIFMANDLAHGNELWISDGTEDGTVMVADIRVGSIGSNPGEFTNARGALFFSANDGATGERLWQTDGTPGGTFMVSSEGSSPTWLTNVKNVLLFAAGDATHGFELWQSGADGTKMVADIRPGTPSSSPSWFGSVGGVLFFQAFDGTAAGQHGVELWKYDVVTPENHNDVVLNLPSGVTVLLNDNSSSYVLHSDTAEVIAVADVDNNGVDDIIVSFPPGTGPTSSGGTWISKNDERILTLLDDKMANAIIAGDFFPGTPDGKDLYIDFGIDGLWFFYNGGLVKAKVLNLSPVAMASGDVDGNGQDDAVLSFLLGTFVLKNLNLPFNLQTMVVLLSASPAKMLATGDVDNNGQYDVIASFPPGTGPTSSGGTWISKNQAGLSLLTSDTAESIAVGNFDGIAGEDLFIKYTGGVALSFEGAQPVALFNFPVPVAMATGDVDESGQDDLLLSVGAGTFIIKNLSAVQVLDGSVALDIAVGNLDGI